MSKFIYKENKNFNEWYNNYANEKKINLITYFTSKDLFILKKLDIKLNNKFYTEKEFNLLNEDLFEYYETDNQDNIIQNKLLKQKKVSKFDYKRILAIFNNIADDYDL